MDAVLTVWAHIMTYLFVVGAVGCAIVIPMVAFKLFRVLFEPNGTDEGGHDISAQA